MSLQFIPLQTQDQGENSYRSVELNADGSWQEELANEYRKICSETVIPLQSISVDGIEVLDTANVRARLERASLPTYASGVFNVVRSDFGELLCSIFLERNNRTIFGYRSLRDRELVQLPGRGIDLIGVEEAERLTLVLGEIKVSNEASSPPQVVDQSGDCLKNQHLGHLGDFNLTSKKIWQSCRRARDKHAQALLASAAFFLESGCSHKLKIVCFCGLVRPKQRHTEGDYGSFKSSPDDYLPGSIRFLVICLPGEVDEVIRGWYATHFGNQ